METSPLGSDDSLLTEAVQDSPVGVGDCKPLTVSRTNVDVQGAEIVVLLMAWERER